MDSAVHAAEAHASQSLASLAARVAAAGAQAASQSAIRASIDAGHELPRSWYHDCHWLGEPLPADVQPNWRFASA